MNYTTEDLERDLSIGREIEFTYQNEKYSISRIDSGFSFTRFYDPSSIQNFKDYSELLKNARIGDELLTDALKKQQISIDIIY